MDNHTPEQRRKNMKAVKNKDSEIERLLRKELWSRGLRYRKNYKKIIGKPDIVFVGKKVAVFCDSEFWHGYDWENKKNEIKSRREFWIPKVMGRIPEDVCIELLKKYQDEKTELVTEIAALESKLSEMEKTTADVDEFIRRLKTYLDVPELTREMCMELIEFVTVDECPGKYSKEPREIHIYYKLIDKQPLPVRKCLEDSTCADN